MTDRAHLEGLLAGDVRAMSAESDQLGRSFAALHDMTSNDFRALLHVMVAEDAGTPLTAGDLRKLMGTSAAAITYLVERMIASGHLRRERHPDDRRKVILRYDHDGLAVARAFFTPLAQRTSNALKDIDDEDLAVAHRVFGVLIEAVRQFQDGLEVNPALAVDDVSPG